MPCRQKIVCDSVVSQVLHVHPLSSADNEREAARIRNMINKYVPLPMPNSRSVHDLVRDALEFRSSHSNGSQHTVAFVLCIAIVPIVLGCICSLRYFQGELRGPAISTITIDQDMRDKKHCMCTCFFFFFSCSLPLQVRHSLSHPHSWPALLCQC